MSTPRILLASCCSANSTGSPTWRGEVVADHETAQFGRMVQRVPERVRRSTRERHHDRLFDVELLDRGTEIADVVFPAIARVGHVAAPAPAHVDDHDPPLAERVEQPFVLVGVLAHARNHEDRREHGIGAAVVERVDADAVVVDEHRCHGQTTSVA